MVQSPGLRSPTSVAQAQLLAGASRPHKPHGTGEEEKKKTKTNQPTRNTKLTNGESKTKHTKTHKVRQFDTHKKEKKGNKKEQSNQQTNP